MDHFIAFIMRLLIFFPGVIGLILVLMIFIYNDSKKGTTWSCVDNFDLVLVNLIKIR